MKREEMESGDEYACVMWKWVGEDRCMWRNRQMEKDSEVWGNQGLLVRILFSVNSSHTLFLATIISVLAPCMSACDIRRAVYLPGCSALTFILQVTRL